MARWFAQERTKTNEFINKWMKIYISGAEKLTHKALHVHSL